MKLALALLTVVLCGGIVHADSRHCNPVDNLDCSPPTTLPPEVYTNYFYINGYYSWTARDGVPMEQFFVDFLEPMPGYPNGLIEWEHGPVASFPNLGVIDPVQFYPNGQPINGPEPATWALALAGVLGLAAFARFRLTS